MHNFKKRFTIELGISLLIIIALLWGIFFFKGNITDYTQRIVTTRNMFSAQTSKILDEASLQGQFNGEAQGYLNVLYTVVPSYDELINLSQSLQLVATQNNLTYGFAFAGETQKSGNTLGSVNFTLSLGGKTTDDLLAFLSSMDNFQYLHSIDSVSIKGDTGNYSMNVAGKVYYR